MERARILKFVLDEASLPKPGCRILHFAPEGGLAQLFRTAVGEENYHPRDFDPDRYKHVGAVERFDLVNQVQTLPEDHYDLILHNHVLEHIPCNLAHVIYHLHRALKPDGFHIFSVPILSGYSEETFAPISGDEKLRRFGQNDHVRRFGLKDIHLSLGMLIRLPIIYDIVERFGEVALRKAGIPEDAWRGLSSHSVFILRKDDFLLGHLSAPSTNLPKGVGQNHYLNG